MVDLGEGSGTPPSVPPYIATFRRLVVAIGKKHETTGKSKFMKKIEEIPTVALSAARSCRTTLNLLERGLIGQFTGLSPSPKVVEHG